MARNRKRAKERRGRRPQPVTSARGASEHPSAPDPIAHGTPDSELAEAQLALGRPDLVADEPADEAEPDDSSADDEYESLPAAADGGGGDRDGGEIELGDGDEAEVPAHRAPEGNRLINFLQGSWRELQRVQWPDRRQVMQATGVVIGFVIVAGVFLGLADLVAGKLANLIIK